MNQKIVYILLPIVAIVALIKFFTPELFQFDNQTNYEEEAITTEEDAAESEYSQKDLNFKTTENFETPAPKASIEIDLPFHSRNRSERLKSEFVKRTYLNIPDMDDYLFEDYSQDNVAVLVGKNNQGDTMTILASRTLIDPGNLDQFIADNSELFPLSGSDIQNGSFQNVMNLDRDLNGFSGVSVHTKSSGGKTFAAFYAPRADKKGAYGIVLEGKKDSLMQNYDYYENKLLNFKARSE